MGKRRAVLAVFLVVWSVPGLQGCGHDAVLTPSSRSESGDGAAGRPATPQFTDIPVPDGASMNLPNTLVLGGADVWVGRLAMSTRRGPSEVFDFYRAEMPKFGWQEVTAVRSATSVLTYRRGARIATVQIQGSSLGSSEMDVTVAPEVSPSGDESRDFPAPMTARPRSTAVERVR
ncbi:MAG: hypothetical protein HQL33_09060 [Alphaproteobacteria bacterium]|nr:hypothetical protein [Alphaproteobacteria bacterium]